MDSDRTKAQDSEEAAVVLTEAVDSEVVLMEAVASDAVVLMEAVDSEVVLMEAVDSEVVLTEAVDSEAVAQEVTETVKEAAEVVLAEAAEEDKVNQVPALVASDRTREVKNETNILYMKSIINQLLYKTYLTHK